MDILELRRQNPWWEDKNRIHEDPKINDYDSAPIKWTPRLKKYIFLDKNVIYSIRGPRQVGKTTLIKLIVRELLEKNNPANILYFSCDLLKDNIALDDLLNSYYGWIRRISTDRVFIFLDEISSVANWQKSIKLFADIYGNKNITIIVTGSHTIDIKNSTERLPGRVGEQEHVPTHKVFLPMKFAEYVEMRNPGLYKQVQKYRLDIAEDRSKQFREIMSGILPSSTHDLLRLLPELDALLDEYLITGGIMIAVNEYVVHKRINAQIYDVYIRYLIGDMARINRDEKTAKLILAAILRRLGSTLSWNGIKKDSGIASQPTVDQYANLLHNMFILNIQYKIELDGTIKHSCDKKVHILNPFIFHSLCHWLINPAQDPFKSANDFILDPEKKSKLIESVIGDHLNRAVHNLYPSDTFDPSDFVFYSRTNKGHEVDFVMKLDSFFTGVEVKYQNAINPEDFRGIIKLGRGCLVSKKELQQKNRITVIPASMFLLYV